MKKVLMAAAVATAFVAPHTYAQSAFEGFYGQIATGYENNQVSSLNATGISQGNPLMRTGIHPIKVLAMHH
ncbi:hypothetical protein A9236_02930 [Polynucleobacter sp. QLW-P1DATA-2]|uniref:hypothetical protein n=1 Tax=Polynucleobacter sp. QLW-P1DATA-2 TaxID=1743167 RepID=UPI0008F8006D|nr:hypothetical protein [Polynucleobacter sp. QLW-P1DATA-2]OIN00253.1 hypothetical protein A9236_02930 [Polynucleobacter sp. QLW-P1DATA-2]